MSDEYQDHCNRLVFPFVGGPYDGHEREISPLFPPPEKEVLPAAVRMPGDVWYLVDNEKRQLVYDPTHS